MYLFLFYKSSRILTYNPFTGAVDSLIPPLTLTVNLKRILTVTSSVHVTQSAAQSSNLPSKNVDLSDVQTHQTRTFHLVKLNGLVGFLYRALLPPAVVKRRDFWLIYGIFTTVSLVHCLTPAL